MKEEANRAVVVAALLGVAAAWNGGNVGPVVGSLRDDLGLSLVTIGLLSGTVFFAAGVIGTLGARPFAERVGLARGMRVACLALIAGNLAFAASPEFAGLAAGRVVAGLGVAVAAVLGPVYARSHGGVRAVAAFGAGFQLGIAGALGLGGLLEHVGVEWRIDFVIAAAVAALPLVFIPSRMGAPVPKPPHGGFLRAAVRSLEVARLTLLFVATMAVPLVVGAWLVHYLSDDGAMRIGVAGALSFVLFGVSAAMRFASGALLARGVPAAVLGGASPLIAAAGLAAIAISTSFPVVAVAVIAMGAGFAIPYSTMVLEAQRLFPAEPLAPLAFVMVWVNAVPIVVVPLVGAALAGGHGPLAFAALAAFVALAGLANLRPADRPIGASG